ncbi:Protein phosphatase 1 regulatory subunit 27 [Acropora cervicornis]|uniref:Protein phosphatase 1 regulatory subunit 27 n=1 Tax=Acropora cervicornis TaxID=6130 RepID=A0AAD9Q3W9_ACRCE|nr:protein phosphatase 1 regulatory subunit 27-like [Acropora millepora]KAK2554292.1 Protein phosphatase 1 regulatory subunit 27 [Acropora cervicornis]
MDRRVKFPHDLVFHDMVKDGDPSEMSNFLKRPSVDTQMLVNTQGGKSNPDFHQLVKDGNLKCVRMLVTLGADVNMQDEQGCTSLHHSVNGGHIAVTKFLLRSGANPDISNADGEFPVDLTDDFDLIEMLVKYSPEEKRRKSLAATK